MKIETRLRYPDPPLSNDVVLLREPSLADSARIARGLHDPDVSHFAYSGRFSDITEDAVRGELMDAWAESHSEGKAIWFAITQPGEEAFLGILQLFRFDWDREMSAEMGFWITPEARGLGLAQAAVELATRWAINDLGLERIEGLTEPNNTGALVVMKRAGFVTEGIRRGLDAAPRGRLDYAVMSLIRSDIG
jgi:RimJ/RimL family protein N-acetyltransferase